MDARYGRATATRKPGPRKRGSCAPRARGSRKKKRSDERRRRHASPLVIERRFERRAPSDASIYAPARSSPNRPSRGTSPRWSPRLTACRVRARASKARTPPRNPWRARAPPRTPGAAPPPRATRRRTSPPPTRARPRQTSSHRTAPSGGPPRARRHAASGPASGRVRPAVVRVSAVPSLHVSETLRLADVRAPRVWGLLREKNPSVATSQIRLCANFSAHTSRGRAGRAASPTLRMVIVVQTSLSALLNDATALEEVRRRALFSSRSPNPGAPCPISRHREALDSKPFKSRRNFRSDLRLPLLFPTGARQRAGGAACFPGARARDRRPPRRAVRLRRGR